MPKLHRLGRIILSYTVAVVLGVMLPLGSAGIALAADFGTVEGSVTDQATSGAINPATIRVEQYDTGELVQRLPSG